MHPPTNLISKAESGSSLDWRKRIVRISGKIAGALVVILGVVFLAFLLSYISPTDPATRYFTDRGMIPTDVELAAKRHELGLDRPFLEQFASWISGMLHGDLGNSLKTGRSVSESLLASLPYTLSLTASSMALTLLIAVPLGVFCAYRKDTFGDKAIRALSYVLCSMPTFFVALSLLFVLSVELHWLPVSSKGATGIIMPTLALGLPLSGWYVRQIRTVVLEQFKEGYVDGLRSRGVSEGKILFKHVLRNALPPIMALVGVSLGGLLGGSAIVECIFGWPGVGNLSVEAISSRDYAVVQGYALLMAVTYLVVNWLIDISYRIIDPRLSLWGGQ